MVEGAGNTLLQLLYKRPDLNPPLELDPTPFVEEEQFDFGVFVQSIVNDPARGNRIYR